MVITKAFTYICVHMYYTNVVNNVNNLMALNRGQNIK